ncbi:transketolase C-terminal domain-containing protein [Micromonospora sp. WMMA1947]|uniref:transketolase C-terminal domain-containing protein n=1 Tax=Micromonospora sp. WMMA1947 TaxID=3015163 RepID=UPI00248CA180|nr:transketolase C-terminal domain-containing protein [Micromonospora sp. WMMA1947]WBC06943.1 transketolase [Micromonospora sp. WMMA1947]
MLSDVTTPHDLDDRLRAELAALGAPDQRRDLGEPLPDGGPLTGAQALALFDAQLTSRLLDLAGLWLHGFGEGYHTIESAGHEGNAAVAAALRPTDPALLHARSGAFYCLRAAQAAGAFPPAPSSPSGTLSDAASPPAATPDTARTGASGAPSDARPDEANPASTAPHPIPASGVPLTATASDTSPVEPIRAFSAPHTAPDFDAAPADPAHASSAPLAVPASGAPSADPAHASSAPLTAPITGAAPAEQARASTAPHTAPASGASSAEPASRPAPAVDASSAEAAPRTALAQPDTAPGALAQPDADSNPSATPTPRDPGRSWSESAPMGAVSYQDLGRAGVRDDVARSDGGGGGEAGRLPSGAAIAVDADGDATVVVPDLPQPAPDDAFAAAARDVLRGIVASAEEPAAGGRAKVFGRADLAVVPTAATAGAHLPRAVGLGLALERLRRGARSADGDAEAAAWPADAVVLCSFDDGAVDHAAVTAALNTTGWYDHTGLRLPVLFVCEDSGRAAEGWVAATLRSRPGIRYFAADGTDVVAGYRVAAEAAAWVRRHRRPAVLHLGAVRLMGPGDGDAARDPLLATARLLVTSGYASGEELLARYDERGWQLRRVAEEVLDEPKLGSPVEIVRELAPRRPVRVSRAVAEAAARAAGPGAGARAEAFGGKPPELTGPLTLAQSITAALADGMLDHPGTVVFGHEVAARGGAHGVTDGLRDRFGAARVFDTLPDETSILGLGLGAGLAGLLPVPEIRHLTSLHGAEDQLRGEAATMRFLSQGAFRNPMVVRVAGLAIPDGLGGYDRNDNSLGALRDVPGLVVAVPARPDDAAPMLRTCLAAARVDGSVCVLVEPVALYHVRDLYTEGDEEWTAEYAEPGAWADRHVPIGRARVYGIGSAEDLTIITFGNGVRMSLRAAATLAEEGVGSRVVDLRWLAPLPVADIIREASATGRVLVVDETRRSGGVGEGVLSALVDTGYVGAARRVAGLDSFVPLGPAARQVLVSAEAITQGARTLLAR